MARGDFHLHSTASDGVERPSWVVETAHRNGVRAMSLTDHDSTEGLLEAREVAARLGVRLIPGIELSTDLGAADVHLLAYGFDPESDALQSFLRWQREVRVGRVETMVGILREEGAEIDVALVFEIAGEASVGRPHVARALMERGHVATVKEAFDRWLGNGLVADVPRAKLSPEDAIRLVHEEGGVVFAAHPYFIGNEYPDAIAQLAAWGLDGIEAYYKHYDEESVTELVLMAGKLGLACSGGSDYHGLGNPDELPIGKFSFPDAAVERFLAYIDEHCAVGAL
jgi:3',5'-nucleoside bisphosphate phosphatase